MGAGVRDVRHSGAKSSQKVQQTFLTVPDIGGRVWKITVVHSGLFLVIWLQICFRSAKFGSWGPPRHSASDCDLRCHIHQCPAGLASSSLVTVSSSYKLLPFIVPCIPCVLHN